MKQSISTPGAPESTERLARQRQHIDSSVAARRERDIAARQRAAAAQLARLHDAMQHPGRGFARLRAAVEQTMAELAFAGGEVE